MITRALGLILGAAVAATPTLAADRALALDSVDAHATVHAPDTRGGIGAPGDVELDDSPALAESVADAADLAVDLSGEDAIAATVSGVEITVPTDPADPITFGTGDVSFAINVPRVENLGSAEKTGDTIAYANANEAIVPVIHDDGTVQLLSVQYSAESLSVFTYEFVLAEGGRVDAAEDGGFVLFGADGEELARAAAPWAEDATGRTIPTAYDIDGATVTQRIEAPANATYPIVADPAITVTTYTSKVIPLGNTTKANFQRLVGGCRVGTANTSCTITANYSEKTSVSGSLGLTAGEVSAQLGFSYEYTASGSSSCTSRQLPKNASFKAYIMGTFYTYRVEKWKTVKSGGRTVTTLVDKTGTQTAFKPSRSIYCVQA